jgi:HSP20 family protein
MDLDRAFSEFFAPTSHRTGRSDSSGTTPRCNLFEEDAAYTIRAEMPGVKRDDLSLDMENGRLQIKGTTKGKTKAYDSEFYEDTTFSRTFRVGDGIDTENIKAELLDGILTVTLPKAEKAKARKITVA